MEAFPDRRYRAVLRQVIPTADRTKATVQVKVTILDKDPQLKPEMSAKVTFLEPRAAAAAGAPPAAPVVTVPARRGGARATASTVVFEVRRGRSRERADRGRAASARARSTVQGGPRRAARPWWRVPRRR